MAKSRHGFTFLSGYKPASYKVTLPGNTDADRMYLRWLEEQGREIPERIPRRSRLDSGLREVRQFKTEAEAIQYVNELMQLPPLSEAAD